MITSGNKKGQNPNTNFKERQNVFRLKDKIAAASTRLKGTTFFENDNEGFCRNRFYFRVSIFLNLLIYQVDQSNYEK